MTIDRFNPCNMQRSDNPYCHEFLKLFKARWNTSKYSTAFHKNAATPSMKRLMSAYLKAHKMSIYYSVLVDYLSSHTEWCVRASSKTDIYPGIEYTQKELEILFAKHLKYEETAEYVGNITRAMLLEQNI